MKKAASLVALSLFVSGGAASAQELTIAGFGGKVQEDLAATLWEPAAEAAGLTLRQETHDGMAGVRVQVQSGNPGWDIVHMGADQCAVGEAAGIFEPLDYDVIDADGIADGAKGKDWIGINSYSVVLAYNTDKYGDNPPKNWADFWNTEEFPGRRALGAYPQEMIEIALLADGVAKEDLYPLDTDRAFDALRRIQPAIDVWWTSGAQSAQLVADGEVDMLAIWGSRVTGVIDNGAPVAFTYTDGILGNGCLAILKGSDNVEAAQKFIAGVVAPETQARIPEMMPYYGPTNQKAFEVATFSDEVLAASNTAPANAEKQVIIDVNWWAENAPLVQEDYKMMMVE
ncbi:ABC transporter substrate-binding protein [Martelella radicis]|uniref:Putative spermidine/putrescine transport system substrate-binding protein n=1 Tax=Martelella radicis TaxID=1397476 RepID=A0A7W6KIS4_9HYPH|nr:ABC transporter substrate-binding protein [Martelella radicis]MBB4122041.1 putative spermidine/putrescine transport system substrate-binding protein [Martelella radicis]